MGEFFFDENPFQLLSLIKYVKISSLGKLLPYDLKQKLLAEFLNRKYRP
jgi:hypothetical protein